MRLAFLVERRWAPHNKWLGHAFTGLPIAVELGPPLAAALAARNWRERERQLCDAAGVLVRATNALGLSDPVDPAPRRFFDRHIKVAPADALVHALIAAVTDREIRQLIGRVGGRADQMPRLPGTIDQAMDSVDVLTDPRRRRASASALGLVDPG